MNSFDTKRNLNNNSFESVTGETLTLSGNTIIADRGSLSYLTHRTFINDTDVIDKKYVDDSIVDLTGITIYNLSSPSTVTVGGLTAGTVLTGKTVTCLLKDILVPFLTPTISSFSVNISSPVEVGCQISSYKSFSWTFTNSSNVQANTMCIKDVTANSTIATNISTTSPQSVLICTKTFTSCGDIQRWCASVKDTQNNQINSSCYAVTSYYPYYYGKCTCPGSAGEGRPTPSCAMVIGGTKVLANSSSSISINFNSTSDDYIWFAIPQSVSDKTCWCVTALNNGAIGGGVSPACNLFPAPSCNISVTTACWSGVNYKVYISNKQTAVSSAMSIS